ncbi:hypothetical protein ACFO3D_13740 [Virgibacillus kekensis]|uniref:Uncharacterized protein n=1 Tax=Virgibacillus kekensis TaxID=202261 RepID=A0ABV9DKK2_9BACI
MDKYNRPLTIQERFAEYNIDEHKKEIKEQMMEIDTGYEIGEEETD